MDLNKYFKNPNKFKGKIIVISAKDEPAKYIKNFVNANKLGLRMNIKYRNSYVAVVDKSAKFVYEEVSEKKIECSYNILNTFIDIVSAGFSAGDSSIIKIENQEFSKKHRGLNIAIFKRKNLKLIDSFYVDTFADQDLTIVR